MKLLAFIKKPSAVSDRFEWISRGDGHDNLFSSKCEFHPQLFREFFSCDIKRILAIKNPSSIGSGSNIWILCQSDSDSYQEIDLNILTQESKYGVNGSGNLVHPKWINSNLTRRWKESCDRLHGHRCTERGLWASLFSARPIYLIDCWRRCLVLAPKTASYVALSYVWGDAVSFKTRKSNIKSLHRVNSLADPKVSLQIPRTIRDAMGLTEALRERYLWVDSLCIVQDGELEKHTDIGNMAAIFANATLTIISTSGYADNGLRGLWGISQPRSFIQAVFKLGRGVSLVPQRHCRPNQSIDVWRTRAWTFQERLFSRKRLIFHDDTVFWECYCAQWHEDVKRTDNHQTLRRYIAQRESDEIDDKIPNMSTLGHLVVEYNTRSLTFPEDAHNAFAGTLSALCRSFKGGFIHGLPVLFFDIGLLWQPYATADYRTVSSKSKPFPSWSWTAWKGPMQVETWSEGSAHVKRDSGAAYGSSTRVIPLVSWYAQSTLDPEKRSIQSEWFKYQKDYTNNTTCSLPSGWQRHEYVSDGRLYSRTYLEDDKFPWPGVSPLCFYKHESDSEKEFWYPLPLNEASDETFVCDSLPLISCRTRRAWLYAGKPTTGSPKGLFFEILVSSLRDREGHWIGALRLRGHPPPDFLGRRLELAEISRSWIYEAGPIYSFSPLDEWNYPERPRKGNLYEYYNVLWIEWEGNIAYRRGLARVEKERWEALDREWFDLTLG